MPKNFAEAKQVLKQAVNRDNDNPVRLDAAGHGLRPRRRPAARRLGDRRKRNNLEGNAKLALASARMAMAGIPKGTPDYIRAQDIALVSCAELKKDKKEKKVNCET